MEALRRVSGGGARLRRLVRGGGGGALRRHAHRSASPTLTLETMNARVRDMEYAVRGRLYDAAVRRSREGRRVVYTNIGNPQALGQRPLSFFRDVLALVSCPERLLDAPRAAGLFAADARRRARAYLDSLALGGTGAYTDSRGCELVRREVADFLHRRDGHAAELGDIFLTDGASSAVSLTLQMLLRSGADAVLTPVPQYPLYAASIALLGGRSVGYELDEAGGWSLSVDELQRAAALARADGATVRALVVINPGNPTGQCLSREAMDDVVRWCARERVVLMADEVYQSNVYAPQRAFTSFRKAIAEHPEASDVECFSFHTVSKGMIGECGHRGGFVHLHNVDSAVNAMMYKVASTTLCANTVGQLLVGLMCRPPRPGEESYDSHTAEVQAVYDSLRRRAARLQAALNELEGVHCQPVEGALYAFPSLELPAALVSEAHAAQTPPDELYCLKLLEDTGICTVPGSGFGQRAHTHHLRTTILPPERELDRVLEDFSGFHARLLDMYR